MDQEASKKIRQCRKDITELKPISIMTDAPKKQERYKSRSSVAKILQKIYNKDKLEATGVDIKSIRIAGI